MQNSFQLVTYVSQSSLSKTCCAADDDDMREKQESLQSFPTTNSDLIDWRINGISPSYNFCCGFCGFGLRYDSVGFCQELQPWLMTTSFAQLKDKEEKRCFFQKMPCFLGFARHLGLWPQGCKGLFPLHFLRNREGKLARGGRESISAYSSTNSILLTFISGACCLIRKRAFDPRSLAKKAERWRLPRLSNMTPFPLVVLT